MAGTLRRERRAGKPLRPAELKALWADLDGNNALQRRYLRGDVVDQVFRGVFENWQARAGVLSATPDAPVVPDDPSRPWRQRLGAFLACLTVR